MILPSSQVEAP